MLETRTVRALRDIAKRYYDRTREYFPPAGRWRDLTDDDIWKAIVSQVVVPGGSAAADRMASSPASQRALEYSRLAALPAGDVSRDVNLVLRENGVRYCSASLEKCRKTAALVHNLRFLSEWAKGPREYAARLADLPSDLQRADRVAGDMKYIKLKGARDLLIELGLASDVLALDVRILNLLKALGTEPASNVTTSRAAYRALESSVLADVCAPAGITGGNLDRILYRNYMEIKGDILRGQY